MLTDQAHALRQLMARQRGSFAVPEAAAIGPRRIALCGASPSVGVSLVAACLGSALEARSLRTSVVDADRIEHARVDDDLVLIAASAPDRTCASRLWQSADLFALVAAPEPDAVLDGYALLKSLASRLPRRTVYLLVNRAADAAGANALALRMRTACQRFLGLPLRWAPLPPDGQAAVPSASWRTPLAGAAGAPPVLAAQVSAFAEAIVQLAAARTSLANLA